MQIIPHVKSFRISNFTCYCPFMAFVNAQQWLTSSAAADRHWVSQSATPPIDPAHQSVTLLTASDQLLVHLLNSVHLQADDFSDELKEKHKGNFGRVSKGNRVITVHGPVQLLVFFSPSCWIASLERSTTNSKCLLLLNGVIGSFWIVEGEHSFLAERYIKMHILDCRSCGLLII